MSWSIRKGDLLDVSIESLSSQGAGIARSDGLVIFVSDACPGDQLQVQVTEKQKSFAKAKIIKIVEPGPSRRIAECPVASNCGGCDWMHVGYSEQLRQKKKIIEDALSRIAKLDIPDFAIVASENEFRYRNRIQIHLESTKLGYHAKKSHRLIEIDDCLIADQRLTAVFPELKTTKHPSNKRVELRLVDEEVKILTSEKSAGFVQVNPSQNEKMIENVLSLIGNIITLRSSGRKVIDLYCGEGNFSLQIAKKYPQLEVVGVDSNSNSIRNAQTACKSQNLSHLSFSCLDSSKYIEQTESLSTSTVLIDPTREGCDQKLLQLLGEKACSSILYISCNPSTWARDLKYLCTQDPTWRIVDLTAFDMFPQTPHIELVSLIQKSF